MGSLPRVVHPFHRLVGAHGLWGIAMKNLIRALVFMYAYWTGHDEYEATEGTLKFQFLNWIYDGEAFSEK